jgi:hypothetical protein
MNPGADSFFVNSSCVVAKDKILTKGKHYMILNIPIKTDIKMTEIVLIDLFFYEGSIHLISEDNNAHRVLIIHFSLECPENDCSRFLVDLNYCIDRMDTKAVRDYCGNYNETKTKPIEADKLKINDDLLEFDF